MSRLDSCCTTLRVPPFQIPLPNPQNQKHKWAEDTFHFPRLQWVKPKKPCRNPEHTALRLVLAISRKTCRKKIHFLQGHQPLEHLAPPPLHCSEPVKIWHDFQHTGVGDAKVTKDKMYPKFLLQVILFPRGYFYSLQPLSCSLNGTKDWINFKQWMWPSNR